MKLSSIAAVALLGTALCGCASVIKGSSQDISLSTTPNDGATCTLNSSRGEWTATTPAQINVKRSKNDIKVHCTKDGFQEASTVIPSEFEPWTLGNLILGGVIGLGVDASTGAINKYPSTVSVPMQSSATGTAEPQRGPVAAPAKASAAPTS
jgi:hypothetical protein